MKLTITTRIDNHYQKVWEGFDVALFRALNPPFPPVKVLEFGGCKPNDKVVLELNFIFFKQTWVSLITAQESNEQAHYFIDEGEKLPFFLTQWKHKHIVKKDGENALIIDEISYKSYFLLEWLLYPAMLLQFAYRIPVYKKYFQRKK
jgi:ligand-binding SRPBCC domain-containing protein